MLDDSYYYGAVIRKTVAVFGTIFNNIYVSKAFNGDLANTIRVPLSYGPRERFLVRIRDADNSKNVDVAIKLPRMAFEITSITYDPSAKLNKNNVQRFPVAGDNGSVTTVRQAVPYLLGMQLSILGDNQDTALQILEQIIPVFNPEYTVTVKDFEGPGSRTDLPIILNNVTMTDDYEGDFETSRRSIIYTLDFTLKIKFVGSVTNKSSIIKDITIDITPPQAGGDMGCSGDTPTSFDRVNVTLGDLVNDTPEDHTIVETFETFGF